MAEYEVRFVASAANEFRSLPADVRERVSVAVERLKRNPRPSGTRKLKGHQHLYRIRVGQYRVVYEIADDARRVRVTRVRHRQQVYR